VSSHSKVRTEEIGVAQALIHRITTTVDGGILVTLAITAQDIALATALMSIRAEDSPLVTVAFVRSNASKQPNHLMDKLT